MEKNQSYLIDMTVDLINHYITTQSALLDVETPTFLDANNIHFLSPRRFMKMTKSVGEACYFPLQRTIYLNQKHSSSLREYNTQLITAYTIIHEGLHSASFLQRSTTTKNLHHLERYKRLGYCIPSFNQISHKYSYFDGFDEAVTNKLVFECIELYEDRLFDYYGELTHKQDSDSIATELKKIAYAFNKHKHQVILDTILTRIAHDKNMSVESVWKEFKKGYFTHDIQCLRMIEETFGKGSLRILSLLNYPKYEDDYSEYLLDNEILGYFQSSNQQKNA